MIDILYLAHNRLQFTQASVAAMIQNTPWNQVRALHLFDDNSTDGTREWLRQQHFPGKVELHEGKWRGPVAVMNEFISTCAGSMFAKIDSDTMLPPRWLNECLKLMSENPTVDLLGIEPMHAVQAECLRRQAEQARFIGGIGVMRANAFRYSLPRPDGRYGFTAWQDNDSEARAAKQLPIGKAWINPGLPVFLLDRMPMEPWASLSAEYEKRGWQRPWAKYGPEKSVLWEWWNG